MVVGGGESHAGTTSVLPQTPASELKEKPPATQFDFFKIGKAPLLENLQKSHPICQ